MKPRVASWRYQRGRRSLAANLLQTQPIRNESIGTVNVASDDDDNDDDVPEEIDEVINVILQALKDKNRDVQ